MDLLVLLQLDYGVVAQRVALDDAAVSIADDDNRMLRVLALLADLTDLNGLDAGCGILLEVNVDSVVHVLELNGAGELGDDRVVVRIPLGDGVANLDLLVLLYLEHGAVRKLVGLLDVPYLIGNGYLGGTAGDDLLALGVGNGLDGVAEPDEAVVLALCGGLCDLTVCGAAHVERSEGKLRARLTD